jgi:ribosomal-protein-alanine N-acetyltransferase
MLRLVDASDVDDFVAYDVRNAEHLRRWEPVRSDASLADRTYRVSAIAQRRAEAAADRSYSFVARLHDSREICASVNLNMVARGAFQAAFLGYSVDAAHQGTGVAYEAVRRVIDIAFGALDLHRVMANYMPVNERSGRLLRRLGFVAEGYARDYLLINGKWEDHILTALVREVVPARA